MMNRPVRSTRKTRTHLQLKPTVEGLERKVVLSGAGTDLVTASKLVLDPAPAGKPVQAAIVAPAGGIKAQATSLESAIERTLNGLLGASRDLLASKIDQGLRKLVDHQENIRRINTGLFGKKKTGWETDFNANLNELGRVSVSNVRVNPKFLSVTFDLFVPLSVRLSGRVRTYVLDAKTLDVSASGRQSVEGRFKVEALISKGSYFVRVNSSDVQLKRLDLDSIGRLGGEGARLLGNAVTGAIRKWRPDIIRNAQDSMNASVIANAKLSGELERLVRTRKV